MNTIPQESSVRTGRLHISRMSAGASSSSPPSSTTSSSSPTPTTRRTHFFHCSWSYTILIVTPFPSLPPLLPPPHTTVTLRHRFSRTLQKRRRKNKN